MAATGDFGGDGRDDLLWRGEGGEVAVWELDGSRILASGLPPNPGGYWLVAA